MKHAVHFLKRIFLLAALILSTTLLTKTHADQTFNLSQQAYYGVERLEISESELREAVATNGGYAVVVLRTYLAMPPGFFNTINIYSEGFKLFTGSEYSLVMLDPNDTLGVVFAGIQYSSKYPIANEPRYHGVYQPSSTNFPMGGVHTSNPFGVNNSAGVLEVTDDGYTTEFAPIIYNMGGLHGTMSANIANGTIACSSGDGTNTYDTIWTKRIVFVIHDVDKFIERGGFDVQVDRRGVENPGFYGSGYARSFMIAVKGNNAPILCNNGFSSGDWLVNSNCGAMFSYPSGGVTVKTKPEINTLQEWKPCPTYIEGSGYGNKVRLASSTYDKGHTLNIQWWHKRGAVMSNTLAGILLTNTSQITSGYNDGTGIDTNSLLLTQAQVHALQTGDSIIQIYRYSTNGGTTYDTVITRTYVTASTLKPLVRGTLGDGTNDPTATVFYQLPAEGVADDYGNTAQSYDRTTNPARARTNSQYFILLNTTVPTAGTASDRNLFDGNYGPDFLDVLATGVLRGEYLNSTDGGATWSIYNTRTAQYHPSSVQQSALTPTSIGITYAYKGTYGTSLPANLKGMEGCVLLSDTIIVKPLALPKPSTITVGWGCGNTHNLTINATVPTMTDNSVPAVKDWYLVVRQESTASTTAPGTAVSNPLDATGVLGVIVDEQSVENSVASGWLKWQTATGFIAYTYQKASGSLQFSAYNYNADMTTTRAFSATNVFAIGAASSPSATGFDIAAFDLAGATPTATSWNTNIGSKTIYAGYVIDNPLKPGTDTVIWTAAIFPSPAAGPSAVVQTAGGEDVLPKLAVVKSLNGNGKPDDTKDTAVMPGQIVPLSFYMYPNPPATVPAAADYKFFYQKTTLDPATNSDEGIWATETAENNVNSVVWNGTYIITSISTNPITETTWYRVVVRGGTSNCTVASAPRKISLKSLAGVGEIVGKSKKGAEELSLTDYNKACYTTVAADQTEIVFRYDGYAAQIADGVADGDIVWQDSIAGVAGWTTHPHNYDSATYNINTATNIDKTHYIRVQVTTADGVKYTPIRTFNIYQIITGGVALAPNPATAEKGQAGLCLSDPFTLVTTVGASQVFKNLQLKSAADGTALTAGANLGSTFALGAAANTYTSSTLTAAATGAHSDNYKYGLVATSDGCKSKLLADSVQIKVNNLALGGAFISEVGSSTTALNDVLCAGSNAWIKATGYWAAANRIWTFSYHRIENGTASPLSVTNVVAGKDTLVQFTTRATGTKDTIKVVATNGPCDTSRTVVITFKNCSLGTMSSDSACAYDNTDYRLYIDLSAQTSGTTVLEDSTSAHTWQTYAATLNDDGTAGAYFTIPASNFTFSEKHWFRANANGSTSPKAYIKVYPKPSTKPTIIPDPAYATNDTFCVGDNIKIAKVTYSNPASSTASWSDVSGMSLKVLVQQWWHNTIGVDNQESNAAIYNNYPSSGTKILAVTDSGTYTYKSIYGYNISGAKFHGDASKTTCYDTQTVQVRHIVVEPVSQLTGATATALNASVCVGDTIRIKGTAAGLADAVSVEYKFFSSVGNDTITHTFTGSIRTADTAIFIADTTRNFYVKITAKGRGDCSATPITSAAAPITVNATPVVTPGSITPSDTVRVCAGETSVWTYSASTIGGTLAYTTYNYNPTTKALSNPVSGTTPLTPVTVASSGHYAIVAVATQGSCSGSDTFVTPYLKVSATPVISGVDIPSWANTDYCKIDDPQHFIATVNATVADSFLYEWKKDAAVIQTHRKGSNIDTFTFYPATSEAGTYSLTVTAFSAGGSCTTASPWTSQNAILNIETPPTITWDSTVTVTATTGTAVTDICEDRALSLSVAVQGSPTSIEWYKDNAPVYTGNPYDLGSAAASMNGDYKVVVTKTGTVCTRRDTSHVKNINVVTYTKVANLDPSIDSVSLCNNEAGVLKTSLAGSAGSDILTYEWFKGAEITPIPSETVATLAITTALAPNVSAGGSQATPFTARLILTSDANGCKDTASLIGLVIRVDCGGKPEVKDSADGTTLTKTNGELVCYGETPRTLRATITNSTALQNANKGVTDVQWQISNDGGSNFVSIGAGMSQSTTSLSNTTIESYLNISAGVLMPGTDYRFRLFVTRADGSTEYSDTVQYYINAQTPAPTAISVDPTADTVCETGTATFTASATQDARAATLDYIWYNSSNAVVGTDAAYTATGDVAKPTQSFNFKLVQSENVAITGLRLRTCYDTATGATVQLKTDLPPTIGSITPSDPQNICETKMGTIADYALGAPNTGVIWYLIGGTDTLDTQVGGTTYSPLVSKAVPNSWGTAELSVMRTVVAVMPGGKCPPASASKNITVYRNPVKMRLCDAYGNDTVTGCPGMEARLDFTAQAEQLTPFLGSIVWKDSSNCNRSTVMCDFMQAVIVGDQTLYPHWKPYDTFTPPPSNYLYASITNGQCGTVYSDTLRIVKYIDTVVSFAPNLLSPVPTTLCVEDTLLLLRTDFGSKDYDSNRFRCYIRETASTPWILIPNSRITVGSKLKGYDTGVIKIPIKNMTKVEIRLIDSNKCGDVKETLHTVTFVFPALISTPAFSHDDIAICKSDISGLEISATTSGYRFTFQAILDTTDLTGLYTAPTQTSPIYKPNQIRPSASDTIMYVRYLLQNVADSACCPSDTSGWVCVTASNPSALGMITPPTAIVCENITGDITFGISSHTGNNLKWYFTNQANTDTIAIDTTTGATTFTPSLNLPGYIPDTWGAKELKTTRTVTVSVKNGLCPATSKIKNIDIARLPARGLIDPNSTGLDTVHVCKEDTVDLNMTASLGDTTIFPITWRMASCSSGTCSDLYQEKNNNTSPNFPSLFGSPTIVEDNMYFVYGRMTNAPCLTVYTDTAYIHILPTAGIMTGHDMVVVDVAGDTIPSGVSVCSNALDMNNVPDVAFKNGLPEYVKIDGYTYRYNSGPIQQGLPNPLQVGIYTITAKLSSGSCSVSDKSVTLNIINSVPKLNIANAVPGSSDTSLSPGLSSDTLTFCSHDTMTVNRGGVPAAYAVKWYVSGNADMSSPCVFDNTFKLDESWQPKANFDTVYYAVAKTYNIAGNTYGCDTVVSDTLKIVVVGVQDDYISYTPYQQCILDTFVFKFISKYPQRADGGLMIYLDTSLDYYGQSFQNGNSLSSLINIPKSEWVMLGDTISFKYKFETSRKSPMGLGGNINNGINASVYLATPVGHGCYFKKDELRNIHYTTNRVDRTIYDTFVQVWMHTLLLPTVIKDPAFLNIDFDTVLCPSGLPVMLNINPLTEGKRKDAPFNSDLLVRYAYDVAKDTNEPISYEVSNPAGWNMTTSYNIDFTPTIHDTVRYLRYRAKDFDGILTTMYPNGNAPSSTCPHDTSKWVKVISYPRPVANITNSADLDNTRYCEGTSVKLKLDWTSADTLRLYRNGVLDTVIVTYSMNGKDSIEVIVSANEHYTLLGTNSKMDGTGTCSFSDTNSSSLMKVDLFADDSTNAGALTINNKKNDSITTPAMLALAITGSNGTEAKLQYTHAVGTAVDLSTFADYAGQDRVAPPYSWNIPADVDAHSDSSYFRVWVKNGLCPGKYSDTVWVAVFEGSRPDAQITNADKSGSYCEGTEIGLRLYHSKTAVMDKVDDGTVSWYAVDLANTNDTLLVVSGKDGTDTAFYISLAAGTYNLFAVYDFDSKTTTDTTASVTVTITKPSIAGTLKISPNTVCEGTSGSQIWLKSSGTFGTIQSNLLFSKDSLAWITRTAANDTNVIREMKRITSDSGYYRIIVQNGAKCQADTSDPILFAVYRKALAGTITVNPQIVPYSGSTQLSFAGYSGIPDGWNIAGTNHAFITPYTCNNVIDRDTVFVAVGNGSSLCDKDTAWAVVLVYDSLVANISPNDPTIVSGGTSTLTATPDNAGLKYSDGSSRETLFDGHNVTYQWYKGTPGSGTPLGSTGANLVVDYTTFAGDPTATYYCVVTSTLVPAVSAITDTVSIRERAPSWAGNIERVISEECYFAADSAIYFITAQGDSVWINWYLKSGATETLQSATGDTIIFTPASILAPYDSIIAYIYDKQNISTPFARRAAKVCLINDIPIVSLSAEIDTVCANSSVPMEVFLDMTGSYQYSLAGYIKLKGDSFTAVPQSPSIGTFAGTDVTMYNPGYAGSTGGFVLDFSGTTPAFDSAVLRLDVSFSFTAKAVDTSLYFTVRVPAQVAAVQVLLPDTVCIGSPVTLEGVVAFGNGLKSAYTYEWKENAASRQTGTSTADTLVYGVVSANPASVWSLSVTDACANVTASNHVSIVVDSVPLSKGSDVIAVVGDSICSYTSTVALYCTDSTGNYTYQWERNTGAGWSDISGATEPHYFISPARFSDRGEYRIEITPAVTSKCATTTATSNPVHVEIDTIPIVDTSFAMSQNVVLRRGDARDLKYPFINGAKVTYVTWYIRLKGESTYQDADMTSHGLVNDTVEINLDVDGISKMFQIKSAPMWLDSADVFAYVRNDCGDIFSDTFHIFITSDLAIKEYDTAQMYQNCVSDGTTTISVFTNIVPDKAVWRVSVNGNPFTNVNAPSANYLITNDGQSLSILNPASATGNRYFVIFNDSVSSDTITFRIDDAVKFACSEPMGIGDTTVLKGSCLTLGYNGCGFNNATEYDTLVFIDSSRIAWLNPAKDTVRTDCYTTAGTFEYMLGVYNRCGGDTATITVRVIDILETDTLVVSGAQDSIFVKDPSDPSRVSKTGICETPTGVLYLHVPDDKGMRTDWQWQVIPQGGSTWQQVDTNTPSVYSYLNDTLVIGAPLREIPLDGASYRLVSYGENNQKDTSVVIQIVISSNDHINTIIATPALIDSVTDLTVTIVALTTATGYQEKEWYKIDRNGNVSPLTAADGFNEPSLTPTGGFNRQDHDSLRFFYITKNLCGDTVYSDTAIIRLYGPVVIEWIDTAENITVCAGDVDIIIPATIIESIFDTVVFEAGKNGVFAPLTPPFYANYDSLYIRINGVLNSTHNGMQLRAIALAGSYSDTTHLITIVVREALPSDVVLSPDTLLCGGGTVEYGITPFSTEWLVKWYANGSVVDSNVATYLHTATVADSGTEIMVILANDCSSDTLRQTIRVQTPDTARIAITSDSASCENSEIEFASVVTTKSGAAHTVNWYADGVKIGEGDTLSYAGLAVGWHKIWAEAVFGAGECLAQSTIVSDTIDVQIFGLPEITAIGANPQVIMVGQTTELYVVHSTGAITWSDTQDVVRPHADTTRTRAAEAGDRPEWKFIATLIDSNGCIARDSVTVQVKTILVLDSIFVDRTVTSDIPAEQNDTLPRVIWRGDTAYIDACPDDIIVLTLFASGDDKPFSYQWYGLTPIEELDERFTFIIDRAPSDWRCVITDTGGNSVTAYVILNYKTTRELILEAFPKMDLGKYYQNQRVEISVSPTRYSSYRFYQYENDVPVKGDSTKVPYYKTSFNYHEDRHNDNVVYASVTDTNYCRITGKLEIGVLPMPNVIILNDPTHPKDNRIFANFRITVYDSWGLKIKDKSDGYGWDGTDRSGRQVKSGTYFYFVEIKTEKGIETLNGAVTVFKK
jgi:hypothetical protein